MHTKDRKKGISSFEDILIACRFSLLNIGVILEKHLCIRSQKYIFKEVKLSEVKYIALHWLESSLIKQRNLGIHDCYLLSNLKSSE